MVTKLLKYGIIISLLTPLSLSAQTPLSETEKLKIEIINLKAALADAKSNHNTCQAKLDKIEVGQNILSLQQAIDSTRPGYTYDLKTGVFNPKESSHEPNPKKREQ